MITSFDSHTAVEIACKYLSFKTQGGQLSRTCLQAHGEGGAQGALKHQALEK